MRKKKIGKRVYRYPQIVILDLSLEYSFLVVSGQHEKIGQGGGITGADAKSVNLDDLYEDELKDEDVED